MLNDKGVKWWWRFSQEHQTLWKKIVCSIHELNPDGIFRSEEKEAKYGLWKSICSIKGWDLHIEKATKQGIKIQVGSRVKVKFWYDIWIGNVTLKEAFPKLFKLSVQQTNCVAEMGAWHGDEWIWQFQWRRIMFQWELPLVENLNLIIADFKPVRAEDDRHIWSFDKSGIYTANSFIDAFYNMKYNQEDHKQWFSHVWKGLAPPRYEILLWAILWKRVNTKDRILTWKTLSWEELTCIFCGECLETVIHLFLHCKFSWHIWTCICDAWGMTWICPLEIDDALLVWNESHFVGFEK